VVAIGSVVVDVVVWERLAGGRGVCAGRREVIYNTKTQSKRESANEDDDDASCEAGKGGIAPKEVR